MTLEINYTAKILIYLIACELHGIKPEQSELCMVDLDGLYRLAGKYMLNSITCMALEDAGVLENTAPETAKKWRDARDKAIRKNMMLDAARETLLNEMEQTGIWYMPLKGIVIKELYPKYGMRQMADNDILFDASKRRELENIFTKHGFKREFSAGSIHDTYIKKPIYNFEMHFELYNPLQGESWAEKYSNIKDRLILDSGRKYAYHFSDEDFYVYNLSHAYKHYSNYGTGLRTLVDIYVLNRKYQSLNRAYVDSELTELGISEFEKNSRQLALRLFGEAQILDEATLPADEREMLSVYLGSGTYGNADILVKNQMAVMGKEYPASKFRYCFSRLFPDMEYIETYFPFFHKHRILLPVLWVWRVIRALLFRRKKILPEIKAVYKLKSK